MLPKVIAVKKTAKASLQNEWPAAIALVAIPLAFYLVSINLFSFSLYIFSATAARVLMAAIFLAAILFIGIPLIMGMLRCFWGMASDTPLKITEIFYYFSSKKEYKRLTVFTFLLLGRMLLSSVALLLPSFIIGLVSRYSALLFASTAEPLWFSNIWIFELLLRSIAICCIVYMVFRFYLAPFIFIADEGADELSVIHKAQQISKTTTGSFITLAFSLIGWLLLSVFFVPMVFTLPYISMCYIIHCRYSVVYYNSKLKKYNENAVEVVL